MSTDSQPIIAFENVSKWFGTFQVLRDIDLGIQEGECIVICGPSGSGKSTLIRCINRLETQDQGMIRVHGVSLGPGQRIPRELRGKIGMVFQSFNLFPHMTVLQNLALAPMRNLKMDKGKAEETALTYLERVHIGDQAEKYPDQLSGGQQQRAAIARALCMKPDILLFDEPTSSLDPEMIREVLDVIYELTDGGITMVCVTHEMGFARKVSNRVVFMDHGEIVESATPDQFFDAPQQERTRAFLNQILHYEASA